MALSQLLVAGDRLMMTDLDSANGVLVLRDGAWVELGVGESVELVPGMRVDLGGAVRFTVEHQ